MMPTVPPVVHLAMTRFLVQVVLSRVLFRRTFVITLVLIILFYSAPGVCAQDLQAEIIPGEFRTGIVTDGDLTPELNGLGQNLFTESVFDGDWYSPALHIGVHIAGKTGTVTILNSSSYRSGDSVLRIGFIKHGHRIGNRIYLPEFDGSHIHLDGRWFNIQGRITPAGRMLIVSRSGFFPPFHWTMERVPRGKSIVEKPCAVPSSVFDGYWYSPELKYGLSICAGQGFFTMPPAQPWANRPGKVLAITSLAGASVDGILAQPDGRPVEVRAERTRDNRLQMAVVGRPGMTWSWIPVGGQSDVQAPSEVQMVQEKIRRHLQKIPAVPAYSYSTTSLADQIATLSIGVGADWLHVGRAQDHYDEFYFAAVDYRSMAVKSLHKAQLAVQGKDTQRAAMYVDNADRYLRLYQLCVDGASAVYAGDLAVATAKAQRIYTASKISAEFVAVAVPGPWASRLVDGLYMATDFFVDANELSLGAASKNLAAGVITNIVLSGVKVPSLGNKSISTVITSESQQLIGSSRLYPTLVEVFGNPEFQKQVMPVLARYGAHYTNKSVSLAIESLLRELPP